MAGGGLRVVRRPKNGGSRRMSLTAASAPVENPQDVLKVGLSGKRNNWQDEAWELLDLVGEFGFYVRWRASSCSRVRLVASEIDPETGLPTGGVADDDPAGQRFAEIVRKTAGGPLGQAQLIKRSAEVLSVPGEFWVAILNRRKPGGRTVEEWYAVTREEIERGTRNNSTTIRLPDGSKHEFKRGTDGMFRVWNPHPRKASEPTSAALGVLEPMREIVRTTKRISNADLSRLISAGILFIPQEASLPQAQAAPVSADKPGDPPAATPQRPTAMALQDMIVQTATTADREGEKSLASLVPMVVAAPGDQLDKIKHITFGDEVTKVALETRNDAIARLAMGVDMSPEQLLGLGKNSNHWNSHLLADQDVQVHVSPVMQTICQAIYDSVLRNVLTGEGIDPDRYTLWYDASPITADPDKTDEAKDAYAGNAITADALVREYGLPEDSVYDLDTPEGVKVFARDAVTKNPALLPMYAQLFKGTQGIEFPRAPALPAGDSGGEDEDERVDPGDEPDTEDESRAASAAPAAGRDVELAVVDLLVGRLLELAGKRRVDSGDGATKARLRGVSPRDYHRYMDPVAERDIPRLIKGWDASFDDEFAAAHGIDPERVRASVMRIARRKLTTEVVDGQVV